MAKYICPYCFTEHDLSDVEFRCVNKFCEKKELDEKKFAKYLGKKKESMSAMNVMFKSTKKAPKLLPKRFMPMWENCPYCGTKTSMCICPNCHNELPEGMRDNKEMIIAVVGSRDSGKTSFISTLINELQCWICPSVFEGDFYPVNDGVYCNYKKNFWEPIYSMIPPRYLSRYYESEWGDPLVFEMIIPWGKKRLRKYTFVFLDSFGNASEFTSMEAISRRDRYIGKASGVIFLLDPLQIMEIRVHMDETIIQESSSIRVEVIEPQAQVYGLKRIADIIREEKGLRKTQPIDVPIAIAVTKFDIIEDLFPKGSVVLEPSSFLREKGRLDKTEWFRVNGEIETMLRGFGEDRFVREVEMMFKKHMFCAVSALGQQPFIEDAFKHLPRIPRPHRVGDPFLWLLNENGIRNYQRK